MMLDLHVELTKQIIGVFFDVYNRLAYGFLEKVYENALAIEMRERGLRVEQQKRVNVYYKGQLIGQYFADLVVNELVLLELKAVRKLLDEHTAQLLNYLKATPFEVGLLLNFGPEPTHVRKVFTNSRKPNLRPTKAAKKSASIPRSSASQLNEVSDEG
jgi:GxxExxY protein